MFDFEKENAAQATVEMSEDKTNAQYYLTIGAENVYSIKYSVPDMEPMGIGRSDVPFEKGKVIILEGLTGCPDLRGLKITAFDEARNIIWTAKVPNSDNEGFTYLQEDDWNITDLGTQQ